MDEPTNAPSVESPVLSQNPSQVRIPKRAVFWFLGGLLLLIIGSLIVYSYLNKPKTIATVNNTPVYKSYVDKEKELYPADVTPEVEKILEQKVIDDQITLEGAKQDGLIKDYYENPSMTTQEYLARAKQVQDVKKQIDESGNSISGTKVMIWMYNNNYIGKMGLAKAKEIAYAKIKPLYDKVKKGEMTIEQAGEEIKNDTSLKELDPVWEVNAISTFRYYKNKRGTFWKEFDDMLWNTKEGELTPLYLGRGKDKNGIMSDELYIFAKVDKKITDKTYTTYDEWLAQQKKKAKITGFKKNASYVFEYFVSKVKAQDTDNSGGDTGGGSGQDSTGSNDGNSQDGGGDNGCNSASPWGCGDGHGWAVWSVRVVSQTGAPVLNARVHYKSGCGESEFNSGSGGFGFGPDPNAGCGCNPHNFTVYQPTSGQSSSLFPKVNAAGPATSPQPSCGRKTRSLSNGDYEVSETLECKVVPPTPTPTPKLVCGKECSKPADCTGSFDGCNSCIPDGTGRKVCSPPACGVSCQKNDECAGAKDGCTMCRADTTGKKICSPPACGVSCEKNDECAGAKDGCVACIKNKDGKKVCGAPSCGTSCTTQDDCAAVKDGCSVCAPNEKGEDVCQKKTEAVSDVCTCDGMDLERADGSSDSIFPGDTVNFISFGKVTGNDTILESVTFALYEGKQSDANTATRIAQSSAIKPEVIGKSANLVQYKTSWKHQMPKTIVPGTLYRLQAKLKCVKRSGVLGDTTSVLADTTVPTGNQQQADTFSPGAQIQEKSCTFIKFFFN